MNESGGTRSSRRSTAMASAGVPDAGGDNRLAELEARLARLENEPGIRERGRKMMDRIVPPEASQHFRNAGREHLLGVRSIIDHWIRRIDDAEAGAGGRSRERIKVE